MESLTAENILVKLLKLDDSSYLGDRCSLHQHYLEHEHLLGFEPQTPNSNIFWWYIYKQFLAFPGWILCTKNNNIKLRETTNNTSWSVNICPYFFYKQLLTRLETNKLLHTSLWEMNFSCHYLFSFQLPTDICFTRRWSELYN